MEVLTFDDKYPHFKREAYFIRCMKNKHIQNGSRVLITR